MISLRVLGFCGRTSQRRGLLVRVYQPGAMLYPHYRPSADLFRALWVLTFLTSHELMSEYYYDKEWGYACADDIEFCEDVMRHMHENFHEDMHRAVSEFVSSDDKRRARTLSDRFAAIYKRSSAALDDAEEEVNP